MTIAFRPALAADYPAICTLIPDEDELFRVYPRGRFPLTVEQLQVLAQTRHELTVAATSARVIGFANLYDLVPGESAFIGNVVIDRDCRGQGFGRRLVGYMLDLAFERHALPEVRIAVFCINAPALRLYADLGFRPYDIEIRVHPRGERVPLLNMRMQRADRVVR